MSVLHLFIAILGILVVAIILSIITWVLQARLSARIGLLETELDKKTAEFDAIKKERASPATPTPLVDLSTPFDLSIEPQLIDDGEIKVMRNVRGSFAEAKDTPSMHEFTGVTITGDGYSPRQNDPLPAPQRYDAPPPAPQPVAPDTAPFVLQLCSPATGRSDFYAVYDALVEHLKSGSGRGIAFDCGGIPFLSGPDLEYLEKMCLSLVAQNREIFIVNCADSLKPLIQMRHQLVPFIR